MAGRPAGRPRCLDGMRYRYSQTDPMKGLGGVFGAHPLIALSVLFVLVERSSLPRQTPCCDLLALPAQGELARRYRDYSSIMLFSGNSAS